MTPCHDPPQYCRAAVGQAGEELSWRAKRSVTSCADKLLTKAARQRESTYLIYRPRTPLVSIGCETREGKCAQKHHGRRKYHYAVVARRFQRWYDDRFLSQRMVGVKVSRRNGRRAEITRILQTRRFVQRCNESTNSSVEGGPCSSNAKRR